MIHAVDDQRRHAEALPLDDDAGSHLSKRETGRVVALTRPVDQEPGTLRSPCFRRELLGTFGLLLVVVMAATGLAAELLAPYSPTANDFSAMMEAPSWAHPLGTDQFGRDD